MRLAPRAGPQGKDWNGQLKWGTSNFYGANYFQSVTPKLSVGGEVFYLAEQQRRWDAGGGGRGAGQGHGALAVQRQLQACQGRCRQGVGHVHSAGTRCRRCPPKATPCPPPARPPARSGFGLAARHAGDKHVATAQVANTGLVSLTYVQKISDKVGEGAGPRAPSGGGRGRVGWALGLLHGAVPQGPAGHRAGTRMNARLHAKTGGTAHITCLSPSSLPARPTACLLPAPARPQVSLASDFMWNLNSREATASFGYDYVLRQCRLRGRIDTGGPMAGTFGRSSGGLLRARTWGALL